MNNRLRFVTIFTFAGLIASACSTTNPSTTEKGAPKLSLNLVDFSNHANDMTALPEAKPPKVDNGVEIDTSYNSDYNDLFVVVAEDNGGIAAMGYSSQFLSFGACNPNSNYGMGTGVSQPSMAVPKNPDNSVKTQYDEFIQGSAKAEWSAECGAQPYAGHDIAGVYIITGTATNYAGHTATATWYINIGPQQTIPTQPKDG
jgi:hypothetical protein